ncbi:MAG: hypothetical protein H6807_02190 [Planctomycetes bacterium]|nr:hypothetical protein [Planctomycetota bacterium]
MRALGPILVVLLLCAGLRAQPEVVADLLRLDVIVHYGYEATRLDGLEAQAQVLVRSSEPGLDLRLSRQAMYEGETIEIRQDWERIGVQVSRARGRFEYRYEDLDRGSRWTRTARDPEAFWTSGEAFRIERGSDEDRIFAGGGRFLRQFLVVVPRWRDDDPRAEGAPDLPERIDVEFLRQLALDHLGRTGQQRSRRFLLELARFVPVPDLPRQSLRAFLRSAATDFAPGEGLGPLAARARAALATRRDDPQLVCQALLRSGHPLDEFPTTRPSPLDYAVYRQLLERGDLPPATSAGLLTLLLDASADTAAHGSWLRRIDGGQLVLEDGDRDRLRTRLRSELSARDPVALLLLSVVNVLGFGALLLALRLLCRRLLFR